jgi:mannose-1-phosphate guanylyltransferase
MIDHYYAVIMAGGGGTRLWPLSRKSRPKQMLNLLEDRSLFQVAVARLEGLFSPDRIFVVTVDEQAIELQAQCPEIPKENYLIEPLPKGTASVVGLAAIALQKRDPEAVMAILTSDHYIGNVSGFKHLLEAAYDVAMEKYLVTLGISPTYPSTGYGYIQQGDFIGNYRTLEVYQALRFKEKPNEADAVQMMATGDHAWNSGMFVWRVDRILGEITEQMPELAKSLMQIASAWGEDQPSAVVQQVWPELKAETIDYGIMEGADQIVVIPAHDLEWSDVGSWDSLFDLLPGDVDGNIIVGDKHIGLDTKQSLVYVDQDQRLIVTIGVEDLVVVDTGDVLLVCRKDQAQRVRQVVNELKESDASFV